MAMSLIIIPFHVTNFNILEYGQFLLFEKNLILNHIAINCKSLPCILKSRTVFLDVLLGVPATSYFVQHLFRNSNIMVRATCV